MKEMPLTKGMLAMIDDDDFDRISGFAWYAGICNGKWYAKRSIKWYDSNGIRHSKPVYMHREILGAQNGQQVDHINGDGLDNRKVNLRFASQSQNLMNRSICGNQFGFKGVHRLNKDRPRPFFARVSSKGIYRMRGYFETPIEAARAYNTLALEFFGPFAKLNPV